MEFLVFTKNFAVKEAVSALSKYKDSVFFFTDRLSLIVCASVFKSPLILIDTLDKSSDDTKWILNKLDERGMGNKAYYIIPSAGKINGTIYGFHFVNGVNELNKVCSFQTKNDETGKGLTLNEHLYRRVKEKLNDDYFNFLSVFYRNGHFDIVCRSKLESTRRYCIRKKLSMENSLEFKQLLFLISDVWSEKNTISTESDHKTNKRLLWGNTNAQSSA
ncbi:hypothetical protein AB4K05_14440 [Kluyvera sp. STS39-E]|uniref:hypothetical protein n=1 Tax=Kluyvera sp. STS39-E TaxID=3234748 RepID=UPI0034C6C04B